MAVNKDSNLYTIIFAAGMVIVVGTILAYLAFSLAPAIRENVRLEKQKNILYAMGVNENVDERSVNFVSTDSVADKFSKYIIEQLVIEGDKITSDKEAYLIDLKKEITAAKNGEVQKMPLFIGEKEGEKFYIIPMYGTGLWDAIWGFVSLDESLTVQGVYFDHKGETPGLGANINQRYFMDDFIGETVLEGSNIVGINVAKGNNDPKNKIKDDNEVDAMAGATITGDGISAMIRTSLKLYRPYLESIKVEK
ncbi:Na(+)-translocating NADH-quinone reductase subunit C [hydrothermal vent metagenome]|uniref:Na(+)-translocating NADH-quinone reductase subunit C n=1 Tax=hydrothermal vent metagenome TaxID=652676 RepID=A0A3B0UBK7_9ZZZZ